MADTTRLNDSAHRRAQIIADQALREAAAAPTNWRAVRKRRSYSSWSTRTALPNPPVADPPASAKK
jgi:hypothetical protein